MRNTLFYILILLSSGQLYGDHIQGSYLTYKHLGYSSSIADTILIEVNYILYADCFEPTFPASKVVLYKEYQPDAYELIDTLTLYRDPPIILDNIDFECKVIPSSLCTEVSFYKGIFKIPVGQDNLYHIISSKCCRFDNTVNIFESETHDLIIDLSINLNNILDADSGPNVMLSNSPTICVGEYVDFSFIISDVQADSISIEKCTGQTYGDNSLNDFPWLPPTFFVDLPFLSQSGYSYNSPFSTNGIWEINQVDQSMVFVSDLVGTFTMACCVREYRSGNLLSSSLIDFQITVTECMNKVTAEIDTNEIGTISTIQLCNDGVIQNLSTDEAFINDVIWNFELENEVLIDTNWSPIVTLPSGIFNGMLILNPMDLCSDTLNFQVMHNSNFGIDFEIGLACKDDPIKFYDLSYSDIPIQSHCYIINGDSFFTANPEVILLETGAYLIQYIIKDEFGCQLEMEKLFYYDPIDVAIQTVTDTTICLDTHYLPIFNQEDFDSWYFENANLFTPIYIAESAYHTLYATLDDCIFSEQLFIDAYDCNAKLYLPNIFSPNNDGINDKFGPLGSDYEVITFRIFDRAGSLIFEATDNETQWDGQFKGKWLDPGVYIYLLEYRETLLGNKLLEHGSVTLIK